MRFVGRGHPAIRATHAKTLELSPDPQITARATCIVAVGTEPEPMTAMAGRVRIRIAAGSERFSLEADANPSWDAGGPAVVRRSPSRRPGTFATNATASSADLPRGLVLALQDPDALVTVDVVPVPQEHATVVLAYVDPALADPGAGLRAEHERANRVVAQDDGARRLLALLGDVPGAAGDATSRRTLVVATADLPRRPPGPTGETVEVLGLGARLAVAAASPSDGALVLADPRLDVGDAVRQAPATARLVVVVPAAALPDVLARAREVRGGSGCMIAQEDVHPVRVGNGAAAELTSSADVAVCFDAADPDEALDPAVRAAVAGLVADGVPTKVAARALAELAGWPRRRAYDFLLTQRP